MVSFSSFVEEMEKIAAGRGLAALELAGLGTLAAPAVAEEAGKKVSDKTKRRAEIGGLGMLAAPYAHQLAPQRVKNFMSGIGSKFKKAAPAGLTGRMVQNLGKAAPQLHVKPIIPKAR